MGDRLFVSVDLDGLASAVEAVQAPFADAGGLRLTDPGGAHVTLQFLGDTAPERVDDVVAELAAAVEAAGVGPFTAEFGGLGVFPSMEYITVVWVGVREGGAELASLQEAIEPRLVAMGFDESDHAFTPHVTVGRLDHAGGKELVQRRVQETDPTVGELTVEEVRLTESTLGPDGPAYTTRARIRL